MRSKMMPKTAQAGSPPGMLEAAPLGEALADEIWALSPVVAYETRPLVPGGAAETFRTTYVSANAERVLGFPASAITAARDTSLIVSRIHEEDRGRVLAEVNAAFARQAPSIELTCRFIRGDDREIWVHTSLCVEYDESGAPGRMLGYHTDVTEQQRVQEQLRESEQRYQFLLKATNEVLFDRDLTRGRVYFSEAMRTVFGVEPPPADQALAWWWDRVHPDDQPAVAATVPRALEHRDVRWSVEYRLRRGDGTWAFVLARGYIVWSADGRATRLVGSILDVTEQRRLEQQFRHAQKLEAVGRLAGSIAHDFNNMLTVIRCRGEFLRDALPPGTELREDVAELLGATERAGQLTAQLLAFSRRQPVEPRLVSVNDVVRGVKTMLGRLMGSGVRLEMALAPALGSVRVDPGQLEQVIVNLAVNARDAMPDGGTLTVRTEDVEVREGEAAQVALGATPGPYVMILVRDTGVGMDAATRERAFEPFFTTKPPGKGTGLGLSTVYAIVRQSRGVVLLDSAAGGGTTFSVLLPRADAAGGAPEP